MGKYHPILPSASIPVYCSEGNWIAIKGPGGLDHIYYVDKVERPWIKEETLDINGKNPCLVYIDGQPYPWYFKTGWERVRSVVIGGQSGGYD